MMNETVCAKGTALAGNAPRNIQLIPFGRHETEKGVFVLDSEGVRSVLEHFGARKNEMAIDYEHQGLTGAEAPAAGWIKSLSDRGEGGIWAEVEWTPRAEQYLKGREYRYLSPVFLKDATTGQVVRLLGAGLTNMPAIDGMVPVVNTGGFPRQKSTEVNGMEQVFAALGLPADAGGDEALEAVNSLRAELEELKSRPAAPEVLEALGLAPGASVSETLGTVAAFRQGHQLAGELSKEVETLTGRLRSMEAEGLVAGAMREGKLTPAQAGWARELAGRDPEAFEAFAAKAPAVLPLAEATVPAAGPSGPGLDELQRTVNRAVGLPDKVFLKHNRPRAGTNQ
jgi:phage I-like protein